MQPKDRPPDRAGKSNPSRRKFVQTVGIGAVSTLGVSGGAHAQPHQPALASIALRTLHVLPHDRLKPAEQVLAQSLQGLVAGKPEAIWLHGGDFYAIVEAELQREGVRLLPSDSVWEVLNTFRKEVKGAILYKLGTPGLNAAVSLCGPMRAVAVDETLLTEAQNAGLKILVDAREMDERQAFARYRGLFAKGVLVEQALDKPGHLRDFSVARRAFTYYTTDRAFRTEVVRALGPGAIVYGWGPDEYDWITDLSRAEATAGAADWCLNLSMLGAIPAGALHRPVRPLPKTEAGVRYLAFVLSDGDNLQWLCGNFISNPNYWANPLRGKFPITWEVSPLLAQDGPLVLKHLYATARPTDAFVTGAGAPGYTYPHFQPDPVALAQQAAPLLRRSDLPIVSVLNANEGSLQETIPLLDRPEVQGMLYKDYAPYNRSAGKILWHKGKPCLSYRYLLWEGLMEPQDVAREVAKMPASPHSDQGSYALVQAHAWSYGKHGGPLEAIRRTIELLPPNTRVITADQMISLLRRNFRAQP